MLTRGLVLLLGTGIFWTVLAAVVAAVTVRKADIRLVLPCSALLVIPGCGWLFLFQQNPEISLVLLLQITALLAAGMANYFMLILVRRAMACGNKGIIWAFTQSSMILPFAMGILLFAEIPTFFRMIGIAFVLLGLVIFAFDRGGNSKTREWILPTAAAFLIAGLAQSFASLPSYFQIEGMTGLKRMLLTQCGILFAFGLDCGFGGKRDFSGLRMKKTWILAGLFGGSNLLALLCFYNGLNDLALSGCASIGYPAAQGLSIALFFIWNRFRGEKASLRAWCAFLFLLLGITLLSLGEIKGVHEENPILSSLHVFLPHTAKSF